MTQVPISGDSKRRYAPAAPLSAPQDQLIVKIVSVLVGLSALIVAATIPAAYYYAADSRLRGLVEVQAHRLASDINLAARQDPNLWNALASDLPVDPADTERFVRAGLEDGEGAAGPGLHAVQWRLYGSAGNPVAEAGGDHRLAWPVLSATAALRNGLGRVEVAASEAEVIRYTLLVSIGSILLGVIIHCSLRRLPIALLSRALQQVSYMAEHDALTGLPNRRALLHHLQAAIGASDAGKGGSVAVLFLDLDNFKEVNDTFGHDGGDELIATVAVRLRRALRAEDLIARIGGDEFAIVIRDASSADEMLDICARLLGAMASREPGQSGSWDVIGLSIGVCLREKDEPVCAPEMLKRADLALYQAKANGRGRACLFEHRLEAAVRARRGLESDLRLALARGDLYLNFQIQADIATFRVVGAEALLRWNRPGHGLVSPAVFIPVAEQLGLMDAIGAFVLRQACHAAVGWPSTRMVAVNVSPVQFRDPGFVETVRAILAESGLAPSRLELEITESLFLKDTADIVATIGRLRELGVRIAVDDFGAGYSSLNYLSRFTFDTLKIDRDFVRSATSTSTALAVLRSMIELGRALGVRVIAEGIETREQLDMLRQTGCREGQGYLLGLPVGPEALMAGLAADPS
ncbi:putative bifunctional diguanylate cyclase/phosphodiesterase [Mongoliimonas terrestris]|uniref:putative bifunctional diguanylate cyclase/phosphodiesterase n=1 Tax=Mongoliimonas terrestris TaxID=1709001 RepID=UPI0009497601|nr:bifunctional diguanylate cyclase/phosphodiesterase [Mongoliimonas terrestris]